MKLPKVALDFATIHDPHKLLMVLAGLDKTHSEILLPDAFSIIELQYPLEKIPIHILKSDEIFRDNFAKGVGLDGMKIDQNHFLAGWQLLNKAYKQGMITLYDQDKYAKDGYNILDAKGGFLEEYFIKPPGFKYGMRFIPDWGYTGNISLIAQYELNGVKPIISDSNFLEYLKLSDTEITLFGEEGKLESEKGIELLLESPEVATVDELFFLAKNGEFVDNISKKISKAKLKKKTSKDLIIMGVEFGSTLTLDTFAFGGIPVSSGLLLVYKVAERAIRVKSKK